VEKKVSNIYILHTRPFKETSLLLNVFGENIGRFSLVAKGVKRKKAQALKAILQPFNLLSIEFTGRGELKTLCHAEPINQPSRMPSRALACGYYLNELLLRSTQEWQEFPELFIYYQHTLKNLHSDCESDSVDYAHYLRNFEVQLLAELGVSPDWQSDIDGSEIRPNSAYQFIVEQGFMLVNSGPANGQPNLTSHQFLGQSIIDLGRGEYHKASLKSSQRVTQLLLRQIIGTKPLESRKLWI